jgi:transcription termination/antitermination protein NusG
MSRGRPKMPLKDRKIRLWYVLNVEHGTDKRVRKELKRQAKIQNVQQIAGVISPRCPQEGPGGKTQRRMMFPGYILVRCKFCPEVMSLVQSVKGSIGFLMNPADPTPLESREAAYVLIQNSKKVPKETEKAPSQTTPSSISYKMDDRVEVIDGTWTGYEGIVKRVNGSLVTIEMPVMGVPTQVHIQPNQLRKL